MVEICVNILGYGKTSAAKQGRCVKTNEEQLGNIRRIRTMS